MEDQLTKGAKKRLTRARKSPDSEYLIL